MSDFFHVAGYAEAARNVGRRGSRGSYSVVPINNLASWTKGWYLNLMLPCFCPLSLSLPLSLCLFSFFLPSFLPSFLPFVFCSLPPFRILLSTRLVVPSCIPCITIYKSFSEARVRPLHRKSGRTGDENGRLRAITDPHGRIPRAS